MAVLHGKRGSVHHKAATGMGTTVINTTNWTLNTTQETAESRVHEANWVERVAGLSDWSATIEGNVKEVAASTLQELIVSASATVGSTAVAAGTTALVLRRSESTGIAFRGIGLITEFSTSAPVDGVQTYSATVVGSGAAIRYA